VHETPFILIVDDDADDLEMLTAYLRQRGFGVIASSSAEAAMDVATTMTPALILLDLRMPGVSGWNAARQLRVHPATRDVIIVAVSAHPVASSAERRAIDAGCDAYVSKPYNLVTFGDAISQVMDHGRDGLRAIAALLPPTDQVLLHGEATGL
jgi:CheY-like chemotaxis protein